MTIGQPAVAGAYEVDFQRIRTGGWRSECVQPSWAAAEEFVVARLVELGEDRWEAQQVASVAGYTAADATRYAVRIYPVSLGATDSGRSCR